MASQEAQESSSSSAAPSNAELSFRIRTLSQDTHEVQVPATCTVEQLKVRLVQTVNIPPERQRLIFRGRVLGDRQLLTDAGVENGHSLHLVEVPADYTPGTGQQQSNEGQTQPNASQPLFQNHIAIGHIDIVGNGDPAQINQVLEAIYQSVGGAAGGAGVFVNAGPPGTEAEAYAQQEPVSLDRHPFHSIALYLDNLRSSQGADQAHAGVARAAYPASQAGYRDRFLAAAAHMLRDRDIPADLQAWLDTAANQQLPQDASAVPPPSAVQRPNAPPTIVHSAGSRPPQPQQPPGTAPAQPAAPTPPARPMIQQRMHWHALEAPAPPHGEYRERPRRQPRADQAPASAAAPRLDATSSLGQAAASASQAAAAQQGRATPQGGASHAHAAAQTSASPAASVGVQTTDQLRGAMAANIGDAATRLAMGTIQMMMGGAGGQAGTQHPGQQVQRMQFQFGPGGLVHAQGNGPAAPPSGTGAASGAGQSPAASAASAAPPQTSTTRPRAPAPAPSTASSGAPPGPAQPGPRLQLPRPPPPAEWPREIPDLRSVARVSTLMMTELITNLATTIRQGPLSELDHISARLQHEAIRGGTSPHLQPIRHEASRASRTLMRLGAALLEMGQAAAVLSQAATGHAVPVIYGSTGFVHPDGQAAMVPVPPGAAVVPFSVSQMTGFRPVGNATPAGGQPAARGTGRDEARARARARSHHSRTETPADGAGAPSTAHEGVQPQEYPRIGAERSGRRRRARAHEASSGEASMPDTLLQPPFEAGQPADEARHQQRQQRHREQRRESEPQGRQWTLEELLEREVQDLPAELLVNTPASGAVPAPAHDPPRAPAAASPSPGTAILRRPDSTGFTVQVHVGGETVELDLVHAVAELAAVLRRCPQLVSLFRPRSQPAGQQGPDSADDRTPDINELAAIPFGLFASDILCSTVATILQRAIGSPASQRGPHSSQTAPPQPTADSLQALGQQLAGSISSLMGAGEGLTQDGLAEQPGGVSMSFSIPANAEGAPLAPPAGQELGAIPVMVTAEVELDADLQPNLQAAGAEALAQHAETEAQPPSSNSFLGEFQNIFSQLQSVREQMAAAADETEASLQHDIPTRHAGAAFSSSQPSTTAASSAQLQAQQPDPAPAASASAAAAPPAASRPTQPRTSSKRPRHSREEDDVPGHVPASAPPPLATDPSSAIFTLAPDLNAAAGSSEVSTRPQPSQLDSVEAPSMAATQPESREDPRSQDSLPSSSTTVPFEAFQPASKPAAASTQQAARKPSIKGLGAGLPGKGSAAGCSVRSSATAQADATPQPSAPTHATSSGQHPQSDSPASSAAAADQPPESATRASRSAATGGSNPARATASEATFNANPAASASPMGGLMGQLMSQMGGSGGSGGGLMDMVGRMAQSPAMQQLAEQLFSGEGAEGEPGGESSQQGGGGPDSGPNMGAIMQQMLPLVSQMLGGSAPSASSRPAAPSSAVSPAGSRAVQRTAQGGGAVRSAAFDALNALSPEAADRWRSTIMADREQQASLQRGPLSAAYRKGTPGHMPFEPLD